MNEDDKVVGGPLRNLTREQIEAISHFVFKAPLSELQIAVASMPNDAAGRLLRNLARGRFKDSERKSRPYSLIRQPTLSEVGLVSDRSIMKLLANSRRN